MTTQPVGCLIESDVRVPAEVKVTAVVAEFTDHLQSDKKVVKILVKY